MTTPTQHTGSGFNPDQPNEVHQVESEQDIDYFNSLSDSKIPSAVFRTVEMQHADAAGRSRTIQVKVRKKRTYVKRDPAITSIRRVEDAIPEVDQPARVDDITTDLGMGAHSTVNAAEDASSLIASTDAMPHLSQPYGVARPQPHAFYGFPTVLDAVNALSPGLKRSVAELHAMTGATLVPVLGNLLGVVSFAAGGGYRIRGLNRKPMPLGLMVRVDAPPLSGKSTSYDRFLDPIIRAMQGWPHAWYFGGTTSAAGIKKTVRHGSMYALLGTDNGDSHLEAKLSQEFELLNHLNSAKIPADIGGNDKPDQHCKQPEGVIFSQIINVHPENAATWLSKHRKEAIRNGYLFRLIMLETEQIAEKGLDIPEVALLEYDAHIAELVKTAQVCLKDGKLGALVTLELESEGKHLLRHMEQKYEAWQANPEFLPWVPRIELRQFFGRVQEQVLRVAGAMHAYEGYAGEVTADTIQGAITICEFLAGEWLRLVYPPPAPVESTSSPVNIDPRIQPEHLSDKVMTALHRQGNRLARVDAMVKTAPNLGMTKPQMKAAIVHICGQGLAQIVLLDGIEHLEVFGIPAHQPMRVISGPAKERQAEVEILRALSAVQMAKPDSAVIDRVQSLGYARACVRRAVGNLLWDGRIKEKTIGRVTFIGLSEHIDKLEDQ